MNGENVLAELIERFAAGQSRPLLVSHAELSDWPDRTFKAVVSASLLIPGPPATQTVCPGCEQHCFKPVEVFPGEHGRAFVFCNEPEDMGRIRVKLEALQQWQITRATISAAVINVLRIKPRRVAPSERAFTNLGLLTGNEEKGPVSLSFDGDVQVIVAGQAIHLAQLLTVGKRGLAADEECLRRIVNARSGEPDIGVGSADWRMQSAKHAADSLHSKPGGSRDKRRRMQDIWATGKYSSRDRCAEEECEALGMSFSTARKALRNTPDPKKPER